MPIGKTLIMFEESCSSKAESWLGWLSYYGGITFGSEAGDYESFFKLEESGAESQPSPLLESNSFFRLS